MAADFQKRAQTEAEDAEALFAAASEMDKEEERKQLRELEALEAELRIRHRAEREQLLLSAAERLSPSAASAKTQQCTAYHPFVASAFTGQLPPP